MCKTQAQYKWSINVSHHLPRLSWIIYIFSITTCLFIMLNLSPLPLLGAHMPCPLSELWFSGVCTSLFSRFLLSLFPFLLSLLRPQVVHFFYRVCAPSPWLLGSTFAFSINFHKAPSYFSSVGFTRAVLHLTRILFTSLSWCTLCSPLLQEQPRLCLQPSWPCSCLHFPFHSGTTTSWNPLSLFPFLPQRPSNSVLSAYYLPFPFIFPETLLGG